MDGPRTSFHSAKIFKKRLPINSLKQNLLKQLEAHYQAMRELIASIPDQAIDVRKCRHNITGEHIVVRYAEGYFCKCCGELQTSLGVLADKSQLSGLSGLCPPSKEPLTPAARNRLQAEVIEKELAEIRHLQKAHDEARGCIFTMDGSHTWVVGQTGARCRNCNYLKEASERPAPAQQGPV